jgi:hypothetical protein
MKCHLSAADAVNLYDPADCHSERREESQSCSSPAHNDQAGDKRDETERSKQRDE